MRQPRLAEMVASTLRNEILSGRLNEGDILPRQEDLLADFKVSPPAVREALRILETEGLISVRRGNVGGAVVHLPSARGVAYMVSLVLQSRQTPIDDVGAALLELEPLCAAICAGRPDRAETVVPALEAITERQAEALNDATAFNRAAREYHETIVAQCGNETMILVIGGLESVWTAHERNVLREDRPEPSVVARRTALRAHEKLTATILSGNADATAQLARRHLDATQAIILGGARQQRNIVAELVRDTHAPGSPVKR
jgi:DNA-binding FadR family transcriptional regulator